MCPFKERGNDNNEGINGMPAFATDDGSPEELKGTALIPLSTVSSIRLSLDYQFSNCVILADFPHYMSAILHFYISHNDIHNSHSQYFKMKALNTELRFSGVILGLVYHKEL